MLMALHERAVIEEAARILTSMRLGAYGKAERTPNKPVHPPCPAGNRLVRRMRLKLKCHRRKDGRMLLSYRLNVVQRPGSYVMEFIKSLQAV
jgi:hypothetical protein